MRHESKCRHLHGHRYTVEVTVKAEGLDGLGRVIDFGVVKQVFGAWVDRHLDHGTVLNQDDAELLSVCQRNDWKCFQMEGNPTAENLAKLLHDQASELLRPHAVQVAGVRIYETPNCWADYP